MKKILSIITAIMLLASLSLVNVSAVDTTFEDSGLTYTVINNHEVSVTAADKTNTSYDIPERITNNGVTYTVTGIGEYAFLKHSQLVSVHIPETVTNIGNNAFSECTALTSVNIPLGIKVLMHDVFYNCQKLESVVIPEGVGKIEYNAFLQCPFTSIVIPSTVTEIGGSAFYNCTRLTSIVLPNDITIGKNAFNYCNKIASVLVIGSKNDKEVNSSIKDALPQGVTSHLGWVDIQATQNIVETQSNKTLNLEDYFKVTSNVMSGSLSIPEQYLKPQYKLTGNVEGNTRIEGNQLIIDPQQSQNFSVETTVNKQTVSLVIDMVESPVKGIEVAQQPVKTSYIEGEVFDPTGLQLRMNYENGTSKLIPYDQNTKDDFKFTVHNPLTLSDTKVVITYANQTAEQKIMVQRKPIVVSPDQNVIRGLKDQYIQGEILSVEVIGAGMDNHSPVKEDIRYRPIQWMITDTQGFEKDMYQVNFDSKTLQVGEYQFTVTYQEEQYDGSQWIEKSTIKQSESFKMKAKELPVIPEEELPEEPLPKENDSVPITSDSTFSVGMVGLALISGSGILMNMKKKRESK